MRGTWECNSWQGKNRCLDTPVVEFRESPMHGDRFLAEWQKLKYS